MRGDRQTDRGKNRVDKDGERKTWRERKTEGEGVTDRDKHRVGQRWRDKDVERKKD